MINELGGVSVFNQLQRSKLFFWSLEILVVATLIWVCTKLGFFVFTYRHLFQNHLHANLIGRGLVLHA